jgi:hypothetical protein
MKLSRADVAQVELRAEDGNAYHHFRWVKKPDPILGHVDRWIDAQVIAPSALVNHAVPERSQE